MWKIRYVRKPILMLDLTFAALMSTGIASHIVKPYSKASLVCTKILTLQPPRHTKFSKHEAFL